MNSITSYAKNLFGGRQDAVSVRRCSVLLGKTFSAMTPGRGIRVALFLLILGICYMRGYSGSARFSQIVRPINIVNGKYVKFRSLEQAFSKQSFPRLIRFQNNTNIVDNVVGENNYQTDHVKIRFRQENAENFHSQMFMLLRKLIILTRKLKKCISNGTLSNLIVREHYLEFDRIMRALNKTFVMLRSARYPTQRHSKVAEILAQLSGRIIVSINEINRFLTAKLYECYQGKTTDWNSEDLARSVAVFARLKIVLQRNLKLIASDWENDHFLRSGKQQKLNVYAGAPALERSHILQELAKQFPFPMPRLEVFKKRPTRKETITLSNTTKPTHTTGSTPAVAITIVPSTRNTTTAAPTTDSFTEIITPRLSSATSPSSVTTTSKDTVSSAPVSSTASANTPANSTTSTATLTVSYLIRSRAPNSSMLDITPFHLKTSETTRNMATASNILPLAAILTPKGDTALSTAQNTTVSIHGARISDTIESAEASRIAKGLAPNITVLHRMARSVHRRLLSNGFYRQLLKGINDELLINVQSNVI